MFNLTFAYLNSCKFKCVNIVKPKFLLYHKIKLGIHFSVSHHKTITRYFSVVGPLDRVIYSQLENKETRNDVKKFRVVMVIGAEVCANKCVITAYKFMLEYAIKTIIFI